MWNKWKGLSEIRIFSGIVGRIFNEAIHFHEFHKGPHNMVGSGNLNSQRIITVFRPTSQTIQTSATLEETHLCCCPVVLVSVLILLVRYFCLMNEFFHLQWLWVFIRLPPIRKMKIKATDTCCALVWRRMSNLFRAHHFCLCWIKILSAATSSVLGNWKTGHACHHGRRRLGADMLANIRKCCLFPQSGGFHLFCSTEIARQLTTEAPLYATLIYSYTIQKMCRYITLRPDSWRESRWFARKVHIPTASRSKTLPLPPASYSSLLETAAKWVLSTCNLCAHPRSEVTVNIKRLCSNGKYFLQWRAEFHTKNIHSLRWQVPVVDQSIQFMGWIPIKHNLSPSQSQLIQLSWHCHAPNGRYQTAFTLDHIRL